MVKYNPEDYELITTLWYTTRNEEDELNTNFVHLQGKNPENAVSVYNVRSLCTGPNDQLGAWAPLGNDFSLFFSGSYIEVNNPENSSITKPYRKLSNLISVPNGQISAEGFYNVSYSIFESNSDIVLNVSSGNGIFEDAKIVYITVDNDGSIFGRKSGRRVEVFKLKPKQSEDIPPDFSGTYERTAYVYGNLNGRKIPLDSPLELKSTLEIRQNGRFTESNFLKPPPDLPKRENLPGVLEPTYNENLKFMGWKLITCDSIVDNGFYSSFATKMENNTVIEYKEIYQESGYQKGNPIQTPLVAYIICRRIVKE